MTAFHIIMLSGHGLPEMPPGGSIESRLKSRMRRLLQLVDYQNDIRHFSLCWRLGFAYHDGRNRVRAFGVGT